MINHDDPRLKNIPYRLRGDEWRRIENEEAGHKLCSRCQGTGNELLAMYRACKDCGASGIAPEGQSDEPTL